jgi:hypothetical protein
MVVTLMQLLEGQEIKPAHKVLPVSLTVRESS